MIALELTLSRGLSGEVRRFDSIMVLETNWHILEENRNGFIIALVAYDSDVVRGCRKC